MKHEPSKVYELSRRFTGECARVGEVLPAPRVSLAAVAMPQCAPSAASVRMFACVAVVRVALRSLRCFQAGPSQLEKGQTESHGGRAAYSVVLFLRVLFRGVICYSGRGL